MQQFLEKRVVVDWGFCRLVHNIEGCARIMFPCYLFFLFSIISSPQISPPCHPEQSEGSLWLMVSEILRFAQNDTLQTIDYTCLRKAKLSASQEDIS
jgi:hypothetical protein